jgi:hypothetical protein
VPASIVQSASANTTTTPATVTLGAAPTVGNTLLAIMSSDTTSTAAPTAGSTRSYTERINAVANQGFYVWTRLVASGDAAATAFTPSGANPAALMVIEVAGTYDTIGTNTHVLATPALTATATGLTPTTTDGLTVALVGFHSVTGAAPTGGTVNNGFTLLRTQFPATNGATLSGIVTGYVVTTTTAATGTTTLSWSVGNGGDRDSLQIAFTGTGGAVTPTRYRRIGKRR